MTLAALRARPSAALRARPSAGVHIALPAHHTKISVIMSLGSPKGADHELGFMIGAEGEGRRAVSAVTAGGSRG